MNEFGRDQVCTNETSRVWPSAPPTRRGPALSPWRLLAAAGLALVALQPALAGNLQVDGSFVSTVPTGTPPLAVASTTRVDGFNADLVDGKDASAFAPAPARVVWVSPSGGDFQNVQAALDSITDASSSNRYLVQVGPGTYIGAVTMKRYVDIAGSGEGLTILRSTSAVTVTGASDAELRDLTVENFSGLSNFVKGIYNPAAALKIVRVTVRMDLANGYPVGIDNDGTPPNGWPLLRHVTVSVQGFQARGVSATDTPATIQDSKITAIGHNSRGLMAVSGASLMLARVEVTAAHGDLDNDTPVHAIWSSASSLEAMDLEVATRGGSPAYGVYLEDGTSRAELARLTVFTHAGGGTNAYGVYTVETALDLGDSEVRATAGASGNIALVNRRSDVRVYRSTLSASGGTSAIGLDNVVGAGTGSTGPLVVEIHASQLRGSDRPLLNSEDFLVRIGASYLGGNSGVYNPAGGTVVCAGVYDEFFTFYADTCP